MVSTLAVYSSSHFKAAPYFIGLQVLDCYKVIYKFVTNTEQESFQADIRKYCEENLTTAYGLVKLLVKASRGHQYMSCVL